MIDLHSHTDESDGSLSPEQLIEAARDASIQTLAITDHDTFAGHDRARPLARERGIELLCGIEISTKLHGRSVHLLGYFPNQPDRLDSLRQWIMDLQTARRERNIRLAARLRELGFDVTLEEAEARGRGMTGRPHFARILVEKGYVSNYRQAFDEYLDESATAYVFRREPQFAEAVGRIRQSGGVASLAHPTRIHGDVARLLPELCEAGLNAIEAYHSDHTEADSALYTELARKHGLLITGGSDFHGVVKPGVRLGTGCEGIPVDVVDRLRAAV